MSDDSMNYEKLEKAIYVLKHAPMDWRELVVARIKKLVLRKWRWNNVFIKSDAVVKQLC